MGIVAASVYALLGVALLAAALELVRHLAERAGRFALQFRGRFAVRSGDLVGHVFEARSLSVGGSALAGVFLALGRFVCSVRVLAVVGPRLLRRHRLCIHHLVDEVVERVVVVVRHSLPSMSGAERSSSSKNASSRSSSRSGSAPSGSAGASPVSSRFDPNGPNESLA